MDKMDFEGLVLWGMTFLAGVPIGIGLDSTLHYLQKEPIIDSFELTRKNEDPYPDLRINFSDGHTRYILGNSDGITLPFDILRRAHLDGKVLIKPSPQIQMLEANVNEEQ